MLKLKSQLSLAIYAPIPNANITLFSQNGSWCTPYLLFFNTSVFEPFETYSLMQQT